jgi:hypothetical protein
MSTHHDDADKDNAGTIACHFEPLAQPDRVPGIPAATAVRSQH